MAVESVTLAKDGHTLTGVSYLVVSIVAGLLARLLGDRRRSSRSCTLAFVLLIEGDPMQLEGAARRITIFVGESDSFHHHSLATEIVQHAHAAGLAGATVLRGIEGYGTSNHIHTTRVLSLSNDLPIVIVVIDCAERVDAFLPELSSLVTEGLVVVEDVEVVKYVGRSGDS